MSTNPEEQILLRWLTNLLVALLVIIGSPLIAICIVLSWIAAGVSEFRYNHRSRK
jgi:hypothetical protein